MPLTPELIDLDTDLKEYEEANKTYYLDFVKNRITNSIDGIESIKQTIYCILNTERYENLIYSWNYGSEFKALIGKDKEFIIGDLKRRIEDALSVDDRIKGINELNISTDKEKMAVNFIVETVYGEITVEQEVSV